MKDLGMRGRMDEFSGACHLHAQHGPARLQLESAFLLLERPVRGAGAAVEVDAPTLPLPAKVLDRLRLAIFVVRDTAHICYLNHAAEQVLQRGNVLRKMHGRLETTVERHTKALHQLVDTATSNVAATSGALVMRAHGDTPGVQLIASLLPMEVTQPRHVLLLACSAPEPDRNSAGLLRRSYGLTAGEARLSMRLATLLNLRDAAAAERLSYETARTYFKRSASKLGVRSQAAVIECVRALALI